MSKYEERASLLTQMRAFTDAHPEMNDDQVSEFEAIEAKYESADAQIKREDAVALRESDLTAPTTTAMVSPETKASTNTELYRNGFDAYLAGDDMGEFKNTMTVGTDADGGYIVPESYQNTVLMKLNAMGRTRGISNVITTQSTLNIPVQGAAPTFAWVAEEGAYGLTDAKFGQGVLSAYKLGGIIKVSEELLQDNMINFDAYMAGQIALGIDAAESVAFATGAGTTKPTGYTVTAATGSNSTVAAVAAVTSLELIDIYYDLKEEYRSTATWRMTDMTEKAIRKLKDGEGNYLYSAGLTEGERPSLLGRPIVIDSNMAEMGAAHKFIVLGDFKYYQIADRGGMAVQRLNELYAANGFVGFKVHKRLDAKVMLAEAFNSGANAAS